MKDQHSINSDELKFVLLPMYHRLEICSKELFKKSYHELNEVEEQKAFDLVLKRLYAKKK